MSQRLPRLRTDLDFMPSPVEERPGLLIRDSFRYSDSTLIVPPLLVECLPLFDGDHTDLDLREKLVQLTGDIMVGHIQEQFLSALSRAGFLEDEEYQRLRSQRRREFEEAAKRNPAHAGSAYPEAAGELRRQLAEYFNDDHGPEEEIPLLGIAAPHVSLAGGRQCYQAGYRLIARRHTDRTFVVLGSSHFGEPERFGLTRKPFVTPLGEAMTDVALVDRLAKAAGPAVVMEDYCHAIEHSIEFQVVFLQYICGPDVRILPVLCGSYAGSIREGGRPEDDEKVRRFLETLGEIAAREGDRLFWVLGVDMAHIGRRYGDSYAVQADCGPMAEVAVRDRERIGRLEDGDAAGFWELVQRNRDDLRWCGASPVYTFMKAVPQARARLERYQQWNIDPQSVVSFAALAFTRAS